MKENLKVVARMVAAPGVLDRLLPEMRRLVDDTRNEAGCIHYDLYQGKDDPNVLVFVEEWETRELWEAHMQGKALQDFNARIGGGMFVQGEVHALGQIA